MNIGEFFVQLGVDADTATLKEFASTIGDLSLDAVGLIAEIGGISFALGDLIKHAVDASIGFQAFTAQTGLSWHELQRWQNAAQLMNVSTEDVTNSIQSLQKQMAEIRIGHGNIFPWQALGIDPRSQNAFQVLEQLRERIKGLDRPMATNLLQQLGINPNMIQLLQLSNDQFSKLTKTVRGMTDEQQQAFLKAKQALVEFGLVLKEHGLDFVMNLVHGFEQLFKLGKDVKSVFLDMAIAVGIMAAALAPLTAGFVILLAVLEDFAVYKAGGKSLIGWVMDQFKEAGNNPQKNPFNVASGNLAKSLGNALPFVPTGIPGVTGSGAMQVINLTVNAVHDLSPERIAKTVTTELKILLRGTSSQQGNGGKS